MGRKLGGLIAAIAAGMLGATSSAIARPSVCDPLDDAASELESATEALYACIRRRDYEEDCSSRARDVRHAAEEYESAVSDASSDLDDVTDVCPAPLRYPRPGLFDDVLQPRRPAGG